MADNNITLKRITGSGTSDNLYPRTIWDQVLSKPTTFTPTSHTHPVSNISDRGNIGNNLMLLQNTSTSTRFLKLNPDHSVSVEADSTFRTSIGAAATSHLHGNITNTGTWNNSPQNIASGDTFVITKSGALNNSSLAFGTATTTFLRNDGAWATTSTVTDPFIYTHRTSDSSRTTSTYTTDLEITSLAANSYYEVVFIGTFYKTSTNSASFRFGFTTSNTTGTPTLFGLAEAATATASVRQDENIFAISTTIVSGSVISTSAETATVTGRNVMFNGIFFTGTAIKALSLVTATSTTLTNGTVGLRTGSMLKVRKIN